MVRGIDVVRKYDLPPDELEQKVDEAFAESQPDAMATQYEESVKEFEEDTILNGRVLNVVNDEVIVDIGYKSEGVIPLAEFGEIAPRHSASLFMKYTFQDGPLRGLGIGGGARGVSEFFALDIDGTTVTRIEAPGYIVADAQVSYDISQNVQAQLDVTNVFDKKYYQRVNEIIRGNFYGEPTRVIFRITARR